MIVVESITHQEARMSQNMLILPKPWNRITYIPHHRPFPNPSFAIPLHLGRPAERKTAYRVLGRAVVEVVENWLIDERDDREHGHCAKRRTSHEMAARACAQCLRAKDGRSCLHFYVVVFVAEMQLRRLLDLLLSTLLSSSLVLSMNRGLPQRSLRGTLREASLHENTTYTLYHEQVRASC